MTLLNKYGGIIPSSNAEYLIDGSAGRRSRNQRVQRGLLVRLQELVEEHMPDELDFFCDWLASTEIDVLWQRHFGHISKTRRPRRVYQIERRLAALFRRLRVIAKDDAICALLLSQREGNNGA
jgi:hypothetical protein